MPHVEPITRTVTVPCGVERAFDVFTVEMGTWWPLETHSIAVDQELDQKAQTLRLDTREGGRIEEVLEDATTREDRGLGSASPSPVRVEAERPPHTAHGGRGALHGRRRRDPRGPRTSRVGAPGEAAERIRPLYSSDGGWTMVLGRYADLLEPGSARPTSGT